MLNCNRIDIGKRVGPTKSNRSKECMICHYGFFNRGFTFQDSVCNDCHDLTMLSVNINDIAIISIKMLIFVVLFITLGNMKQLIY